jgi:hypothetical protein
MATNLSVRLLAETLRSLAFGSISGTYAGIGTALAHPARLIKFTNTTDVLLTISLDGVNDHDVIPTNSSYILDIASNQVLPAGSLTISQGQRFYVKGTPSSGSIYLSVYYGSNS